MSALNTLPDWYTSYRDKLIIDALNELRRHGYTFVCTKEHIEAIKQRHPTCYVKKIHRYAYLIDLGVKT